MQPDPISLGSARTPPSVPITKIHAEVLSALVRREEWRAEELAAELYLSEGAVRSHLNVLAEMGMVHVRAERGGPGRPRHLYSITSDGRSTFPTGYHQWLLAVLDLLRDQFPDVYADLGNRLVASGMPNEHVLGESVAARLDQFERHMAELGHQMQATRGATGERIEVFNCGSFHAARAHPWICETERAWIQTHFPEQEVALTACMTAGSATCVFSLEVREAGLG